MVATAPSARSSATTPSNATRFRASAGEASSLNFAARRLLILGRSAGLFAGPTRARLNYWANADHRGARSGRKPAIPSQGEGSDIGYYWGQRALGRPSSSRSSSGTLAWKPAPRRSAAPPRDDRRRRGTEGVSREQVANNPFMQSGPPCSSAFSQWSEPAVRARDRPTSKALFEVGSGRRAAIARPRWFGSVFPRFGQVLAKAPRLAR